MYIRQTVLVHADAGAPLTYRRLVDLLLQQFHFLPGGELLLQPPSETTT
jgi:hypothetical protein